MKIFLWIIGFILIIYILVCIYMYLYQDKFLFFPNNQSFLSCDWFLSYSKENINWTRFYYKHTSDKVIVFYHGNAWSACDRSYLNSYFEKFWYSIIIVEYAGYSNDTRSPSKDLILQDVRNINEFINKSSYKEVVLIGESIWTWPASYHSTLEKNSKLVLVSPYTSIREVSKSIFPFLPIWLLLKHNFTNDDWLKSFEWNILIVHWLLDNVIPFYFWKKLFDSIPTSKKVLYQIADGGHNNIYSFTDFWKQLELFIKN